MAQRAVLVTGASRGIGRAVAEAFAGQGDRVAVHHRGSPGLAAQVLAGLPGDGHTVVRADLADPNPEANTLDRYRTGTCADWRGGSGIDVLRQRRRARPSSVAASRVLARVKVMIMPWAAPCT